MSKKIIYIIGAGRSGTTLLDVLLGNAEGVFSGGELNRYPIAHGVVKGLENQPERTAFWRHFGEEFIPGRDLARQQQVYHQVEYHLSYLKRRLGLGSKKVFQEYQQYIRNFFQLLFEQREEEFIVDSSKYPGRAVALSETLDCPIYYIYIKRDPVHVVRSFAKTDMYIPTKSWLVANIYYLIVNYLCKISLRSLRKGHRLFELRYEDLIREPEQTLRQISQAFDIDLSSVIQKVANDDYLEVGELFAGNTMRMKNKIKLRRQTPEVNWNLRNRLTRIINLRQYS